MHINFLNWSAILFVALGSVSYGYCASIIATTLGQTYFNEYFHLYTDDEHISHTNNITGAMNGVFQGGGFIGCLMIGPIADKFSRKGAILVASFLSLLGGALQAGAVNPAMFLVARGISGVGTGMMVTIVPIYQSEIAPAHSRGSQVGTHGVLIGTSYALAGWIGYACYQLSGQVQWRLPLAIQCVPSSLLIMGIWAIPETPRWLLANNKPEKALDTLRRLRYAPNVPTNETDIQDEFYAMRKQFELDISKGHGSYSEFVKVPANRKRVVIGFLTTFAAQCTGTIVINNYGVTLYSAIGYGGRDSLALTAGWVTTSILGNFICALILDRVGRIRCLGK
ncbi:general substrate transporter [Dipodascopsis uninucleata]